MDIYKIQHRSHQAFLKRHNLVNPASLTSLFRRPFVCFCVSFFQVLDRHIFTPPSASSARCWTSWPSYGCSCVPLPCGFPKDTFPGCSGGIGRLTSVTLQRDNYLFTSLKLACGCINAFVPPCAIMSYMYAGFPPSLSLQQLIYMPPTDQWIQRRDSSLHSA